MSNDLLPGVKRRPERPDHFHYALRILIGATGMLPLLLIIGNLIANQTPHRVSVVIITITERRETF